MPSKNMAAASLGSAKRWSVVLGLAVAFAFTGVPLALKDVSAHHGWPTFDTSRLVYIAGTVSSEGVWGNPHSEFDVKLDASLPPDTPELPIPEELQHPEDNVRVDRALAYDGGLGELEIVIAPPAWSGRWGLDRPLKVGERFLAVGYINRSDEGLFRPVVFWYGDDATPVNQVLGNTLPERAPLPD